jgi:hypothetical protein
MLLFHQCIDFSFKTFSEIMIKREMQINKMSVASQMTGRLQFKE